MSDKYYAVIEIPNLDSSAYSKRIYKDFVFSSVEEAIAFFYNIGYNYNDILDCFYIPQGIIINDCLHGVIGYIYKNNGIFHMDTHQKEE